MGHLTVTPLSHHGITENASHALNTFQVRLANITFSLGLRCAESDISLILDKIRTVNGSNQRAIDQLIHLLVLLMGM